MELDLQSVKLAELGHLTQVYLTYLQLSLAMFTLIIGGAAATMAYAFNKPNSKFTPLGLKMMIVICFGAGITFGYCIWEGIQINNAILSLKKFFGFHHVAHGALLTIVVGLFSCSLMVMGFTLLSIHKNLKRNNEKVLSQQDKET